jgi:cobalt-zinc-cadmium resistance protein CzcA
MFDQIVKLSIKNRWLVLIVFLFIGALGVYNYFKLPIDAVPDITNVQVQINSEAQGYLQWRWSHRSLIQLKRLWLVFLI